jgi:chromate reductase
MTAAIFWRRLIWRRPRMVNADGNRDPSARGQSQLRQAFEFTNSYCMPQPEILVFKAHEKFDAEGNLADAGTRQYLSRFLLAFETWVRRFKP